jgi:hypothetical protein
LVVPAELQAEMNDPVKRDQIDPAQYYFRTNPLFETGSSQYAWLNDVVCVGLAIWSKAPSRTKSRK